MKHGVWQTIAFSVKTLNGKKADATAGREFFNSGKKKLTVLNNKASKSGSAAESVAQSQDRQFMMKTFSFLKDHIVPSS